MSIKKQFSAIPGMVRLLVVALWGLTLVSCGAGIDEDVEAVRPTDRPAAASGSDWPSFEGSILLSGFAAGAGVGLPLGLRVGAGVTPAPTEAERHSRRNRN